jgi:AcrR family transcriptional regulator
MLGAAGRAVARLGPSFTLADAAAEAGIAAGTLVQRFGSRHGLLTAMMRDAIATLRREMAARVSGVEDPVAAVAEALVRWYAPLDDPATAANNLAQLAVDLGDPELRELMAELYAAMEAELAPLLERAALDGAPPTAARILTAVADGCAIHWSARPIGSLAERMRADLDAILAGWH